MIYPGSIHVKRFRHFLMLSTISITIFIGEVQESVFQLSKSLVIEVSTFAPTANKYTSKIEALASILEKLENSRWGKTVEGFGFPTSQDIRTDINAIQKLDQVSQDLIPFLKIVEIILKLTSLILIIQILYAFIWMGIDLQKGHQKLMTIIYILIAVGINIWSHEYLTNNFII